MILINELVFVQDFLVELERGNHYSCGVITNINILCQDYDQLERCVGLLTTGSQPLLCNQVN